MIFKDEDDAVRAIMTAAFEAGLIRSRLHVAPWMGTGFNNEFMDRVTISFPGGTATGTTDQIISAIRKSSSFERLAVICREDGLSPKTPSS